MLLLEAYCLIKMAIGFWDIIVTWANVLLLKRNCEGILDGFIILLNKGYRQYTIQTDNAEVVKALSDKKMEDTNITILRRVQRIIYSKGQWRIRVVPRESNMIVDHLAKECLAWKPCLQIFDVPPKEVLGDLQQDKVRGVIEPLIRCNLFFNLSPKKKKTNSIY